MFKRLINNLALVCFVILMIPAVLTAEEDDTLKDHKLTGTVVSHDKKYTNSCILDDRIMWEGETYIVVDGKIKYRFVLSKNVKLRDGETLAKISKITPHKVNVEYEGKTYTFTDKRDG